MKEQQQTRLITTADIVDAIFFVKFKDGRVRQVILSQGEISQLVSMAAMLRPQFQVLDEDQGINFHR
jgi:hypothetical protein